MLFPSSQLHLKQNRLEDSPTPQPNVGPDHETGRDSLFLVKLSSRVTKTAKTTQNGGTNKFCTKTNIWDNFELQFQCKPTKVAAYLIKLALGGKLAQKDEISSDVHKSFGDVPQVLVKNVTKFVRIRQGV